MVQFYLIDPKTKSFVLSQLLSHSKKALIEEAKKCQLLCSDCHIDKTRTNKDGYEKRLRGEKVWISKMTDQEVADVKERRANGETLTQLSKRYKKITKSAMYAIIRGRSWKHVP